MALKVLICGGGIAGPALAYWLARIGHQVIIVERFPMLRSAGSQIDLRGPGIEAVRRMGLMDAIREKLVDEAGVSIVDSDDNVKATILANRSGKGSQSLTSEYEIMRGDLVRILHDATKEKVIWKFGKTVDSFIEHDKGITAYLSDGSSDTFDMLVGADGQGSRIRRDILPPDAPNEHHQLGFHVAYWFVPRIESDNNMCKSYLSPGGRMIMSRSHNKTDTQVYFLLRSNSEEVCSVPKMSIEQQKKFWADKFRNAGWQTDRFLEGLKTTDNWFCQNVIQIKSDIWHSDRVVLLGDAAYCPSPLSGMGTTSSLIGAYVLAGELAHSDDPSQAFEKYTQKVRPFIDEVQQLNISWIRRAVPDSQWAIFILHWLIQLACFLRIPYVISRFSTDTHGGWELPDYPELNVECDRPEIK